MPFTAGTPVMAAARHTLAPTLTAAPAAAGGPVGTPRINGAGGIGGTPGGTDGTPTLANATVHVTMNGLDQPVAYISVNGGPLEPVIVDTGSTGLVIEPQYVPTQDLGSEVFSGSAGYSGGLTYSYDTYDTTVSFGSGLVTSPTAVDLVTPGSTSAFENYFASSGCSWRFGHWAG
jgi:hypothetical protein